MPVSSKIVKRFIVFERAGEAWEIRNRKSSELLAEISWYAPWRQFCMTDVGEDVVFNSDCLRDIAGFLDELNRDRRREGMA